MFSTRTNLVEHKRNCPVRSERQFCKSGLAQVVEIKKSIARLKGTITPIDSIFFDVLFSSIVTIIQQIYIQYISTTSFFYGIIPCHMPDYDNTEIINVHECNGKNIFTRRKMECSRDRIQQINWVGFNEVLYKLLYCCLL